MRVAVPSTPANYFHLLRRQALSPKKKPLIVFTPKSLLRHRPRSRRSPTSPTARSSRCSPTRVTARPGAGSTRVLLCSGKVYYDLVQARADRGITDTAIVRVEQLYPLPVDEIKAALAAVPGRPRTSSGCRRSRPTRAPGRSSRSTCSSTSTGVPLRRISRPAAAAPAVGSAKVHEAQQAAILDAALPRP